MSAFPKDTASCLDGFSSILFLSFRVLSREAVNTVFKIFGLVVVVDYPTPSEGWGHGGRPWSPRRRETPQGLDQRS